MTPRRRPLLRRPRSKRSILLTAAAAIAALVLGAVAVVYFVIFPTSSPSRFTLSTSTRAETAQTPASTGGRLSGRWSVASGSQAGYRVLEKLAFLPAQSQAVGRTSSITGAATLTQTHAITITRASFVVDVESLKSDRSMRDEKIRSIGLESERYPSATFTLSKPIALPATASNGKVVHATATGALTIHGSTRTEAIPVELRLSSSELEAVGAITFPWSRFNMVAPSIGGFVSVTNSATMEFDLQLRRT